MENQLVLSLFPGIGLLDMAFEELGFCVVRGPDVLWGGNIKKFNPLPGRFDGIIGGPPCQTFSRLRHIVIHNGGKVAENLIPEFERCVTEAAPGWFLMENVRDAPVPLIDNYCTSSFMLDNRWLGEVQRRERRFTFGITGPYAVDLRDFIQLAALEAFDFTSVVCASGVNLETRIKLNGSGRPKRKHPRAVEGGCQVSKKTVRFSLKM